MGFNEIIRVPIFYDDDLEEWISWMEKYFSDQGFLEEEKLQFGSAYIEGDARTWFESHDSRVPFTNWEALKAGLLVRFGNDKDHQYIRDIAEIKQLLRELIRLRSSQTEASVPKLVASEEVLKEEVLKGETLSDGEKLMVPRDIDLPMVPSDKEQQMLEGTKRKDDESAETVCQVFDEMSVREKRKTKKKKKVRTKIKYGRRCNKQGLRHVKMLRGWTIVTKKLAKWKKRKLKQMKKIKQRWRKKTSLEADYLRSAELAVRLTISDHDLWKTLSSLQDFENKYLSLTKGAAENHYRSWWKRHGVVLDGKIAVICFKHGKYDLAANSYEKVCALYGGVRWQDLLADLLPNLAECQKILNDQAGYMSSCVKLLTLDKGLFSSKERQAFQTEVVDLAQSEMKNPVPLDVSFLITFSGNTGPPLQLCDGDPGNLSVTVWSGFPDDITLDSLSLTLVATNNTDEGGQALKSSTATVLKSGRNIITFALPPQKPGSYVLGVVTGQIGRLRFSCHNFSKGGPADSDEFMSYEKPTRPILKDSKPRALVDLVAAVSSALLINEAQWIGIIVRPIDYSLKGAVLHIDTDPGLKIEDSYGIEMERYMNTSCDAGASKAECVYQVFEQMSVRGKGRTKKKKKRWKKLSKKRFGIMFNWFQDKGVKHNMEKLLHTQKNVSENCRKKLSMSCDRVSYQGLYTHQVFRKQPMLKITKNKKKRTRLAEQGRKGIRLVCVTLLMGKKTIMKKLARWKRHKCKQKHTQKKIKGYDSVGFRIKINKIGLLTQLRWLLRVTQRKKKRKRQQNYMESHERIRKILLVVDMELKLEQVTHQANREQYVGSKAEGEHELSRRLKTQFLIEMGGFHSGSEQNSPNRIYK